MQVANNEGATLTLTYNIANLSISKIVLDATQAFVPTFWKVLDSSGNQVFPISGQPLAIQPGQTSTWNLSPGAATMGTITDSQGQTHVVSPPDYQLLTWN
jgi:hypothetical protein